MPTDNKHYLHWACKAELGVLSPHNYHSPYGTTNAQMIRTFGIRLYSNRPNCDYTAVVLQPDLANGFPEQVDDIGCVWRIHILPNQKWENGDPLTAADCFYSFRQQLDPLLKNLKAVNIMHGYITIRNAEKYWNQEEIDGHKADWSDVGIKLIDPLTLEITTESPQSVEDVMHHFANTPLTLVHKETYERSKTSGGTATTYGADTDRLMCGGPFVVEAWKDGEFIQLRKNPNYAHQDEIHIDGISVKLNCPPEEQLPRFLAGELDYISLSSGEVENYLNDSRLLRAPDKAITSLNINTANPEKPFLNNVNFRRALFFAVDRAALAAATMDLPAGYFISSARMTDAVSGQRYRDTAVAKENLLPNHGYAPELAKAAMTQALLEEGVEHFAISILHNTSRRQTQLATLLKEQLVSLFGSEHLTVEPEAVAQSELFARSGKWKTEPASWDLCFAGWPGSVTAPWNALKYHTQFYGNEPWKCDEFDAIWKEANYGGQNADPAARIRLTAQMEAVLFREVPFIPLTEEMHYYLKNPRFVLPKDEPLPGGSFAWNYGYIKE